MTQKNQLCCGVITCRGGSAIYKKIKYLIMVPGEWRGGGIHGALSFICCGKRQKLKILVLGTFSVEDFHRPNGAKILRFCNFPHILTYPRGVENCQKSMSCSKIWLWKSSNFGTIFWPAKIFFFEK